MSVTAFRQYIIKRNSRAESVQKFICVSVVLGCNSFYYSRNTVFNGGSDLWIPLHIQLLLCDTSPHYRIVLHCITLYRISIQCRATLA